MARVDEGKTLEGKIEARRKRNIRDILVTMSANGHKYQSQQSHHADRRRASLNRGAARRKGEKIVGHVSRFQTGINMVEGRFLRSQKILNDLRTCETEKRASLRQNWSYSNPSPEYYVAQIEREISAQRATTKLISGR